MHSLSGPVFPSCPSGAKCLLCADSCVPACKEDILTGMSPASVHISGEEQVHWPVSLQWLLGPVSCSRGSPGALPSSARVVVALGVGAGGSKATPAPIGRHASNTSTELSTARGAALHHGLQPQGVSWVIFLLFLMLSWQCVSAESALVSSR